MPVIRHMGGGRGLWSIPGWPDEKRKRIVVEGWGGVWCGGAHL